MINKLWLKTLVIPMVLILGACGGFSNTENESSDEESDEVVNDNNDATYSLRLGHQSPEETNIHQFGVEFKEIVEEKTDGEVFIDIYPFRQLGVDRELLEAMQFGTLDMALINDPPVSGFATETGILGLPSLFEDWDHVNAFLDSEAKDKYKKLTEDADLKINGIMARGFRHVTNSEKPIETLEDIKGKTIRVIESPVYVDAYKKIGASPQSMNWGDAYTALEQGAVDAQENTIDIVHDENVAEVQDYLSKTGVNFAYNFLMSSKEQYDSWPEEIQKAIDDSAEEAAQKLSKMNEEKIGDFEEKLEEKGMEINDFDRSQFDNQFDEIYKEWEENHGDELLNDIQDLK